jgi:3-deoxy-D-manno-octulosonic-acid transferase
MRVLYTLSIFLYLLAIRIASLFNPKAKKWVEGRRRLFSRLKADCHGSGKIIWFHCASLGEFEQGRPLMEEMKKRDPSCRILLTFFSPSGYDIRKDYDKADFVYYLPVDTSRNARLFLDIVRPDSVYIIKYEFWYNLLAELGRRKIPTYLVSGIFRQEQYFFKWYGAWFVNQLKCFSRFYVQDEMSQQLLNSIGFNNAVVTGDTRFDRVASIAAESRELPLVKAFCGEKRVLIAGSSWEKDTDLIAQLPFKSKDLKLIIAPHEIGAAEIQETMARFQNTLKVIRYSEADLIHAKEADVLIIDNIGMLSSLYKYGSLAYIGGGFGNGIHNILEAAVWNLPVIFGPNYHKFSEAHELIKRGGAFCVHDEKELQILVTRLLDDAGLRTSIAEISGDYVRTNSGATNKILADSGLV